MRTAVHGGTVTSAIPAIAPNQPPGNICYRKLPLSNSLSHCAAFCKHRVIFFPNKKGARSAAFPQTSASEALLASNLVRSKPGKASGPLSRFTPFTPRPSCSRTRHRKQQRARGISTASPLAKVSESKPSGGTDPSVPVTRPYANSLRPASSSAFSSASAASRLASFANTYSLIFGSVPLGRTMTLLPPSASNSTTLAEGRPFTPPW